MEHLAAARRALGRAARPRTPRTSAARAPQRRQNARPVAEHLAALLAQPVGRPCPRAQRSRRYARRGHSLRRGRCSGDRARGRAERLAAGGEGVGPRPRGPARHLPQHADHARRRGARPHPLPAGQDPRLVLHGPRQRGRRRSASRPRWAPDDVGTPLHRDMGVHITRGVEPWRIFAQYMGRADGPTQGTRRQRPHGRRAPRPDRDGQRTCRRCSRSRSAARSRSGSARRSASRSPGSARARSARGDTHEAMNFAGVRQLPGRLHLRQQPVGVLDADAPRVRGRAPRRPRRRRTASRASSSTAPTCSPSTARRSARSRRRATAAARR